MMPPRGAISDFQIGVRFAYSARDVHLDGHHRDPQMVRHLLVRIFVKYPQRKYRTALRGQPIDCLLYEPVAFVAQHSRLRRLAFSIVPRLIEARQCAPLHRLSMAEFICCQVTRSGEKKSPERSHGIALPIGTQKCFLDDFFRRLTGAHEAANISMQCLAALGEELDESLGAG